MTFGAHRPYVDSHPRTAQRKGSATLGREHTYTPTEGKTKTARSAILRAAHDGGRRWAAISRMTIWSRSIAFVAITYRRRASSYSRAVTPPILEITLKPKPEAAVVWGQLASSRSTPRAIATLRVHILRRGYAAVRCRNLQRRDLGKWRLPRTTTAAKPIDKPDEFTRITRV